MKTVYVNDLSVIAPGILDKETLYQVMNDGMHWQAEEFPKFSPKMLPANERRRTTQHIKLALQTMQSLLKSDDKLAEISTVFSSCNGDLEIVDKICRALATPEKMVSPTIFHNSVHNAPAGYWAIAASMVSSSVSVSSGLHSFASGLMESVAQVITEETTVFYVASDIPAPKPINALISQQYPVGIALRLGPQAEPGTLGSIKLSLGERSLTKCRNKSLEPLRNDNPVAQGITLVEALIRRARMPVVLPYLQQQQLIVDVTHGI